MTGNFTRRASLGMMVGAVAGVGACEAGPAIGPDPKRCPGGILVNTRGELSQLDRRQEAAFLLESGREGLFRWEVGNFVKAVESDPAQAVHVPARDDPKGSAGVWQRILKEEINLSWFGAKLDVGQYKKIEDSSDDSDAWDAALSYLSYVGGGTLYIPQGASKVTRQITVNCNSIRIVGTGTRKVYPGRFVPGSQVTSTLIPFHRERNAFRFLAVNQGDGEFCMENMSLATIEGSKTPESAFGWEVGSKFLYGFTFRRVAIHGFTSAFDVYKTDGKENAVGAVLIENCVINRNKWIARTLNKTQFNGFRFFSNKAGQNGYLPGCGGISISGHDIVIESNILEGTRDPVAISGSYRDIQIRGNYFEANVGTACVQLRDILGPYSVGPNNYSILDYSKIDHKVLLKFCGLGACLDPYWPYVAHKLPAPLLGSTPASNLKNDVRSSEYGFCRLDTPDSAARLAFLRVANVPSATNGAVMDPERGMSLQLYRTVGAGWAAHQYAIEGQVGEWVVMSWLFQRQSDQSDPANPYVSLKVNKDASGGSRDYVAYGFAQAWRDGEWCLMTAAIRLEVAMSSLQVLLYPHGMKPAPGRVTRYIPPTLRVVSNISDVSVA